MPTVVCAENDPRVADMRRRLDDFYRTTSEYEAFKEVSIQTMFWGPVIDEIRRLASAHPGRRVRILEFGAGRTGFPAALGDLRSRAEIHAQDVTDQNRDYLALHADMVHVGDVLGLTGPYDVIFSTFVWEHVSNPRALLGHVLGMLAPGGSLFLASPRYDAPGYVPPSARHYGSARQLALLARLQAARLRTALGGPPSFLVHLDPAVLHRPWFRDADAVHWASIYDLRRALPRGFALRRLNVATSGWKRWVWKRFLLLFVHITKAPG